MDILDRLLAHDAWTTRQLLMRCQELSEEQFDTEFDIGHRSARATLLHIISNMELWSDLMKGEMAQARSEDRPRGRNLTTLLRRLDRAAADLGDIAHEVARVDGWDERWTDTMDDPPREKTYGGAIAHILIHSTHHRAQLLYMLRKLGVQDLPDGDVFTWENQVRPVTPSPTGMSADDDD